MDLVEEAKKTLEKSYSSEIGKIYLVFSNSFAMADNDQGRIDEAKARFKKGFQLAKQIYNEALGLIS